MGYKFSFYCNNLLNLLSCHALPLKYLDFLTLSINSWHSNIEVVETMDASCALHLSLSWHCCLGDYCWILPLHVEYPFLPL